MKTIISSIKWASLIVKKHGQYVFGFRRQVELSQFALIAKLYKDNDNFARKTKMKEFLFIVE